MKLIPLSQNGKHKGKYFAKVDDEDFEWLSKLTWTVATSKRHTPYALHHKHVSGKGETRIAKTVSMHRMILSALPTEQVDHKDGDGLNNQRINLRKCTPGENSKNRKSVTGSSSKYVGVNLHRCKIKTKAGVRIKESWRAGITINGKPTHIGLYKTEIDAAKARDAAAKKHYGEFARLNIIE